MTLPNLVTLSRVFLMPFFLVMFLRGDATGYAVAFGLLALCEQSDMLDGAIARARKQTSSVGMLLDPMADTITRFCMFLGLLSAGILPLWMALVLFVRDMSIAYLRSFAMAEGIVISARWSGKLKAGFQAAALVIVCMGFMMKHHQAYVSGSAGVVLWASAIVGVIGPIVLALIMRLDRAATLKMCAFSALLLIPVLTAWFAPGQPVWFGIFMKAALWGAILMTIYSFVDYMNGFRTRNAAADKVVGVAPTVPVQS